MSDPLDPHEKAIGSFRRRLALLLLLRQAVGAATAVMFVHGAALLATRVAPGLPAPSLPFSLALLGLVVAALTPRALRQVPPAASVRALFDARGGHGGLLMAAAETPLGGWGAGLSSAARLRILWDKRKAFSLLGLGIAFVLLAAFLPARLVSPARSLEVKRDVEKLASDIEALKEEKLLDEKRAEALDEKLKELSADASGNDPAKTWEALDHLAENVRAAAQEGAEAALGKAQRLGQAEALAQGIAGDLAAFSPGVLADAMADLGKRVSEAAKENKGLTESLSKELLEAMRSGSLTKEQLKELAGALKGTKEQKLASAKKLFAAGLIDLKTLREAEKLAGGEARESLASFLKENPSETGDGIKKWCRAPGNGPGKGGVDRGRGDAELTYGKASPEDGKFKEKVLPPAAVDALRETQLLGVSPAEPGAAGKAESTQTGALASAQAAGGSAAKEPILPRHKEAVSRYFDRAAREGRETKSNPGRGE